MLSVKNRIVRALSVVFLWGYLLNVISFETFHQAIHHHDHSELHSDEDEEDACHRAIYHGDVSADCKHESHFAETDTDCELCKVLTSRSKQFIGTSFVENSLFSFFSQDFNFGSDLVLEPSLLQSFLRGPPTA